MWSSSKIVPRRNILSAILCCVVLLGAATVQGGGVQSSTAFHLFGETPPNPVVPSVFEVVTNLVPPEPIVPPNPCQLDLSNPLQPALTLNVRNHALFEFGMIGPGGGAVTFDSLAVVHNPDLPPTDSHLMLYAQANFGENRHLDVFFDTFFTYPEGPAAPFSFNLVDPITAPPEPIYPAGSFTIDFASMIDPPFTVEISIIDPVSGSPATFTVAPVPEPGALALWAAGLTILTGWRIRRTKKTPSIAGPMPPMLLLHR